MIEDHFARDPADGGLAPRVFIFGQLMHDFAGALQAGQGFADLGADAHNLKNRPHQKCQEHGELEELADGQVAGDDLARAHVHDQRAHDAHHGGAAEVHQGGGGEALHDIVEQALDAAGKDRGFGFLGVIAFYHAHAAQRFGEAAGHFRINLAALAEDGAQHFERLS